MTAPAQGPPGLPPLALSPGSLLSEVFLHLAQSLFAGQPLPHSALPPPTLGYPTLGELWDLPLGRRTPDGEADGLPVSCLSDTGLGLTDVLPGFVLIARFKNSSYPPTVQIIIFQVARNCDYFSCCLL